MSVSFLKQYFALLLQTTGYFAFCRWRKLRKKAVILMYHRVLPNKYHSEVSVQAGMYVTPESFRLHLGYLKSKFIIIPLWELATKIRAGEDISGCCAITFDDGWIDNYQFVFPIIQEFRIPITIFIVTGHVGTTRWFWPEELSWCISWINENDISSDSIPAEYIKVLTCDNDVPIKDNNYIDLNIEEVKKWDPKRRNQLISWCSQFRKANKNIANRRLLLNWDEIKEMADSRLVTFGSHTTTHALLDQLSENAIEFEIDNSIDQLQKEIDQSIVLIAYPNGNYSKDVIKILPKYGVRAAVTTKRGLVHDSISLYELPRIALHEDISNSESLLQWRLFVQ